MHREVLLIPFFSLFRLSGFTATRFNHIKQLIFRLDNLHSQIPLSLPAQIILIESLLLPPVSEFEA